MGTVAEKRYITTDDMYLKLTYFNPAKLNLGLYFSSELKGFIAKTNSTHFNVKIDSKKRFLHFVFGTEGSYRILKDNIKRGNNVTSECLRHRVNCEDLAYHLMSETSWSEGTSRLGVWDNKTKTFLVRY